MNPTKTNTAKTMARQTVGALCEKITQPSAMVLNKTKRQSLRSFLEIIWLTLGIFVVVAILFAPLVSNGAELTLQWDHVSEDSSNLHYRVYSETNIATLSTNSPVTIIHGMSNTVRVVVNPGRRFWMVTATNIWGESAPSNIYAAPSLLTNVPGLKITKP